MALVWFFCLGGLGIWFPYFSLYLHENAGLAGGQLGLVLATVPALGIVAQPFWGQVADRTGSRARVLSVVAFGAALGYSALYLASGFAALLLGTALLAFFSAALVPNAVSVTLALARSAGPHAFGRSRVWGTIGFLVTVVAFPRLLDVMQRRGGLETVAGGPSEPGLELMFPLTGLLVLVGAFATLALPRTGALSLRAPRGDWRRLARHGPYLRLLVFALGSYLCLQGPMSLFPIFVRAHGGSMSSVSDMWILMLALEIPLIWMSGSSLQRLGPRGLLATGVLAGGVRWLVCGTVDWWPLIYAAQTLHGVVVAGLVIGGPLYVEAVVPERLRSTGQGVLAMVGISFGGIASQVSAGWLLEHLGPNAPYVVGGLGALALGLLVPVLLPPPAQPEGAEEGRQEGDVP